ncbi:topoisomerase DNA-binding C4 zinc finger domain-containing protein [Priestia abyssalis]|nr:topoisomerase DNA-binding C4 zinc finger domain-containing protein [Priestia abyssalis]
MRKEKEVSQQNVCPKCGGELSMRKGKYGSFYGCSNFPKCRYTKQVL